MKIYIQNDNTHMMNKLDMNTHHPAIEKYIVSRNLHKEIYTKHGIYRIENNRTLRKLAINDGEVVHIDNFVNNISVMLDQTIIKKEMSQVSCIPNQCFEINKIVTKYCLRNKSPLVMVIETCPKTSSVLDIYFQLNESYAAYSEADLNNVFIKKDLITFIELLH